MPTYRNDGQAIEFGAYLTDHTDICYKSISIRAGNIVSVEYEVDDPDLVMLSGSPAVRWFPYQGAMPDGSGVDLWDAAKDYGYPAIVSDNSGAYYGAEKDVPAGTPLTDAEYWHVFQSSAGSTDTQLREGVDVSDGQKLSDLISGTDVLATEGYVGDGFVKLGSPTTQLIDSDLSLGEGNQILTVTQSGQEYALVGDGVYATRIGDGKYLGRVVETQLSNIEVDQLPAASYPGKVLHTTDDEYAHNDGTNWYFEGVAQLTFTEQEEFGSEHIHFNANSPDRPTVDLPSGKEAFAFLSDVLGDGSFLGEVDFSYQDKDWEPLDVADGTTGVTYDFVDNVVQHGLFHGGSWAYTDVDVSLGDYYFIHETIKSANEFAGFRSIVVWVGPPRYFITFNVSSVLRLADQTDQPFSVMKDLIDENGIFIFQDQGCQWNFRDLVSLAYLMNTAPYQDHLSSAYKDFPSANLARRWAIEWDKKVFWVDDIANGTGRIYLIQPDANGDAVAVADTVDGDIIGTAIVLPYNFSQHTDGDIAFLSDYIHFTRPLHIIETFDELYKDIGTSMGYGVKRQEDKNDTQDAAIEQKIENVRMGDLLLPKYADGSPNIPNVNSAGQAPNPDFLGVFHDLQSLKDEVAIDNFIQEDEDGVLFVPNFAYNGATGKTILGVDNGAGSNIPMNNAEITGRATQAGTGTGFTEWHFTGFPLDPGPYDSFIHYLNMTNPVDGLTFGSTSPISIYRYDIDSNLTAAKVCDLYVYRRGQGMSQVYYRLPGSDTQYFLYSHGTAPNVGCLPSFTNTYNGVDIIWHGDDPQRQNIWLEFSKRVSCVDSRTAAIKATWNKLYGYDDPSGIRCSWFVDGDLGWAWDDSTYNIGDPRYPRHIDSAVGSDGYLSSAQLTQIDSIIKARRGLPSDFSDGSLLNGIITSYNDAGSAAIADAWNTRYLNYTEDKMVVYNKDANDWAVTVTLYDGAATSDPVIQSYTLIDSNNDWVFPRLEFDASFRLNLTEDFYYRPVWDAGEPWSDTRILDETEVTLQEIADESATTSEVAAYAASSIPSLQDGKANKAGSAPAPPQYLGELPEGYVYRSVVEGTDMSVNPGTLWLDFVNFPSTFNTVLDEFFYVFRSDDPNRTWQCIMGIKASNMTQWGPAGNQYPPNIEGYEGGPGTGYYLQYIAYSRDNPDVPTDPALLFDYYKSQGTWSGANIGFQYVYVVPGSGYPSGEPKWQMSGSLSNGRLNPTKATAMNLTMFNTVQALTLVHKEGNVPFQVPVFTTNPAWDMPLIGGWIDFPPTYDFINQDEGLDTTAQTVVGAINEIGSRTIQTAYTENYSEAEQQVGWYTRANGDRKPVYKRYFTGQISVEGSVNDDLTLIETNSGVVETFLGATGAAQIGASSRMLDINSSRGDNSSYDYFFAVNQNSSGLNLMSWCKYTRVGTANTYRVWASYTKATDAWTPA